MHKVITKVNKQLKDIGKELNIPIDLTTYCGRIAYMPFLVFFHLARHSFASLIALEEGVPIETIRLMLGHSNIKITQLYAHVTPKRLFEEMDKYIEATKDLKLIL